MTCPNIIAGLALAESGVDPDLCRDDVEGGHGARHSFNVIPAVMAKPCFAWTAGTHASLHAHDARDHRGEGSP